MKQLQAARAGDAKTSSQVVVVPVQTRRQRKGFLEFPWELHRGDPNWIPPLRGQQAELVGYKPHPFYDAAESQSFLAYRGTHVVGRILAIVNHAYNKAYNAPRGFFGFFESIDDVEVAHALFTAARQWLAERNLTQMRGPLNPSMNYECGLLVDGFDSPPTFMMTYNPAYYPRLFEACGMIKAQDLLAYFGHIDQMPSVDSKFGQIAEQVVERYSVTLRPLDRRHFVRDVETFLTMYNGSMVLTWDYVPISDSEMHHMAASLRYLLIPELAMIAEVEGKPSGVVVCLPDYNPRIKKIDGRLYPFGFIRMLYNKRAIKRVRVVAINVLPEAQRLGWGWCCYVVSWRPPWPTASARRSFLGCSNRATFPGWVSKKGAPRSTRRIASTTRPIAERVLAIGGRFTAKARQALRKKQTCSTPWPSLARGRTLRRWKEWASYGLRVRLSESARCDVQSVD